MIPTENICGLPFITAPVQTAVDEIVGWIGNKETKNAGPRWFACVNPHSVEVSYRDPEFRNALHDADLITPDGIGILAASVLQGGVIKHRVCGPDLFGGISDYLNRTMPGTRVFFLGGTPDALQRTCERFKREFPNLVLAGSYAPPFRDASTTRDDLETVAILNAAGPDLVWVGLGAPKQEKWCYRNRHRIRASVLGPIGGVFDFYSGRIKLPPRWVQRIGLIWLFRLVQEPKRLARRNLDAPKFLLRVVNLRLRGK